MLFVIAVQLILAATIKDGRYKKNINHSLFSLLLQSLKIKWDSFLVSTDNTWESPPLSELIRVDTQDDTHWPVDLANALGKRICSDELGQLLQVYLRAPGIL